MALASGHHGEPLFNKEGRRLEESEKMRLAIYMIYRTPSDIAVCSLCAATIMTNCVCQLKLV